MRVVLALVKQGNMQGPVVGYIMPSLSHDPTAIEAPIISDCSRMRLGVIGGRRVSIAT